MKELTIELPEILLDDDNPYTMLSNDRVRINLSYVRGNGSVHHESVIMPLPKPKGMWMVKCCDKRKMILIDV